MPNTAYDVAIIGGGHNGLCCAAYLAKAGISTIVLEKNDVVGGAAITEEFHPGFRNSVASYTVSLLNPQVIKDLELRRRGLEIVERPVANFWPVDRERYLLMPHDMAGRQKAIAQFSRHDADQLPRYDRALQRAADVLRELALVTPPNAGGGLTELIRSAAFGRNVLKLELEDQRNVVDLFTKSAADYLDRWFESDVVKAAFAFDGIVGAYASPHTPGTAYVLLHHCFGEVNGKAGVWGHAIGGMGAISDAILRAAQGYGAIVRTAAPVDEVIVQDGRARGVRLDSGEVMHTRVVAANVGAKMLLRDLVADDAVGQELTERFRSIKTGSGTFRMNVALSELPNFECLPNSVDGGQMPHHGAGIIVGPTMSYLDKAYLDARRDGWSSEPIVEMVIASTLDPTLAPKDKHVASLFVQHVAPQLTKPRSWVDEREKQAFADVVVGAVTRFAPNFQSSIIARQVLSPLDLERRFGLIDGDIFHGQMSLDQLFVLRPVMGFAQYRMPVDGLYLCGAGAHPGGGVTGLPGRNAARQIVKDLRRQPPWMRE